MKAHFVIIISANKKMELQAEVLIRSIKTTGRCPDSFFTIFTHEIEKITNVYIKNHELINYNQNVFLKYPWSVCPRWDVSSAADLIIGLDSDVVVLKDLNPLLEQLHNKKGMFGTICCNDNFSIANWKELFDLASIEFPQKTYMTANRQNCPYYINNGVVALSSEYLFDIKRSLKKMIDLVNIKWHHDYWITQRANTLAAYDCNVPLNIMPKEFNHLESCYGEATDDTYFFHYNASKYNHLFNPKIFLNKIL